MSSRPTMPRGRPPKYVKGRDGKPITGLSLSSQGRYYSTHSKPRKTFGRDFDQALMRFRQWERKGTIPLSDLRPIIPKADQEECVAEGWITKEEARKLTPWPADVPEDAFYSTVRELILQNPVRFAERVGIPEIGHLQDLPKPAPSTKLSDCLNEYEGKRKRPSADETRKVRQAWTLFVSCVKPAKKLQDVAEPEFNKWVDRVFLEYEDGDGSPKTVHH